jgi:uncharacterized protein (DUF1499 family)
MSTTFGVEIKDDVIEVAFRSNGMRFINELAHLLPDDTPVIALDNSQQGVYTIGDVKDAIGKTDLTAEYYRTIKI